MSTEYLMFIGVILFLIGLTFWISFHIKHQKFLKKINFRERYSERVQIISSNNESFKFFFIIVAIIGIIIFVSSVASPHFFLT